jgi:hypothetical protein
MPIAATPGAAPVGPTWRELSALEDLDLDYDLEDWPYSAMSSAHRSGLFSWKARIMSTQR